MHLKCLSLLHRLCFKFICELLYCFKRQILCLCNNIKRNAKINQIPCCFKLGAFLSDCNSAFFADGDTAIFGGSYARTVVALMNFLIVLKCKFCTFWRKKFEKIQKCLRCRIIIKSVHPLSQLWLEPRQWNNCNWDSGIAVIVSAE